MDYESDVMKQTNLKKLKWSRRGKKSAITKRLDILDRMISEGGSRRIISALLDKMQKSLEELQQVCDQISSYTDSVDEDNCLETVRINVDTCVAFAMEYLEERKNDESTVTSSTTSSWIQKYVLKEQVNDICSGGDDGDKDMESERECQGKAGLREDQYDQGTGAEKEQGKTLREESGIPFSSLNEILSFRQTGMHKAGGIQEIGGGIKDYDNQVRRDESGIPLASLNEKLSFRQIETVGVDTTYTNQDSNDYNGNAKHTDGKHAPQQIDGESDIQFEGPKSMKQMVATGSTGISFSSNKISFSRSVNPKAGRSEEQLKELELSAKRDDVRKRSGNSCNRETAWKDLPGSNTMDMMNSYDALFETNSSELSEGCPRSASKGSINFKTCSQRLQPRAPPLLYFYFCYYNQY